MKIAITSILRDINVSWNIERYEIWNFNLDIYNCKYIFMITLKSGKRYNFYCEDINGKFVKMIRGAFKTLL